MYPTLSDILKDLFGINIPLPVQTFGLFLMFSFMAAYIYMYYELKRKKSLGIFQPQETLVITGKKKGIDSYIISAIVYFVVCYKLLYIVENYSFFSMNPQSFILSSAGNFLGGIIGIVLGIATTYYENYKLKDVAYEEKTEEKYPHDLMMNFAIYAGIAGLLGAKIFHNLENLEEFSTDPIDAIFSFSGLTFYGGLICGAIAVLWHARKNNVPLLHLLDASAPALILAYGVGRIGCQLSGDGDWGIENTAAQPDWISFLPHWMWSYDYPHNVVNEGIFIPNCEGQHCSHLAQSVFPTPFYETVMSLVIFFVLIFIKKLFKQTGILFGIYLSLNGLERFTIEQIRVNTKYHLFGIDFTQAQLISILMMLGGIVFIVYLKKFYKEKIHVENAEEFSE